MKYFTREELEDITGRLIENPTRETLKELHEKYNNIDKVEEKTTENIPNMNIEPPVVAPIETVKIEETPIVQELPPVVEEKPVVSPIPNINIPSMEVPKEVNVNANVGPVIPSFELPKVDVPQSNNQNNEIINITGNLWETQAPSPNNLMQTTDNFNSVPNTMPSAEVPIQSGPFFGATSSPVNNPIPIAGTPTNKAPTMFGQFEKNYM